MGPALIALLLAFGDVDVAAGAAAETRAGSAPVIPGATPLLFAAEIVTPLLALRLSSAALSFRVAYAPRIFWESPRPPAASAVLVLHVVSLDAEAHLTPALTTIATAAGSVGEPDYTSLPGVLGTTQGFLPPVVRLSSVSGQLGNRLRATRRLELDLGLQVFYWQWLDQPPPTAIENITGQATITAAPGASFRVTPRHDLGGTVVLGAGWYSNGAQVQTMTPLATWRIRLNLLDSLRFAVGLTAAHFKGPVAGIESDQSTVSPVGSVAVDADLVRRGGLHMRATAAAGVDYYLDPALAAPGSRAFVQTGVVLTLAPSWAVAAGAEFATSLRTTPLTGDPDETAFAVFVSARRRLSSNFAGELGGRWADRAPALASPNFAFGQRQLWAYLTLTGVLRSGLGGHGSHGAIDGTPLAGLAPGRN